MVKFTEVPGMWLSILTDVDKASAVIKKSKPGLMDGIVSVLFASIIVGLVLFLVSSVMMAKAFSAAGSAFSHFAGLGYLFIFLLCVVIFQLVAVVGLLIICGLFRLAVKFAGGGGDYNASAGYLGIVISVEALVAAIFYMIVFAAQALGASFSMSLFFLVFGVAYLIFGPLLGLLGGLLLDLISHFEKVSVPRSGMIQGLTSGIAVFLVMLLLAVIAMVVPMTMNVSGGGGWYSPY